MAAIVKSKTNFVKGTVISISNHKQCAFDSFLRYVLFPG